MKKISNAAALIAAGALLFGGLFFSCSSDGLPPELGGGSSPENPDAKDSDGDTSKDNAEAITYAGPDSWDFVSQADTVDWVKAVTSAVTDVSEKTEDSDTITYKITKSGGLEVAGKDNVSKLILEPYSADNKAVFAYYAPTAGLRIKSEAIKITGVTGKVKVTVDWISWKPDGRTLTLTDVTAKGAAKTADTLTAAATPATDKQEETMYVQESIEKIYNLGTSKKTITLTASNHVFIKSIKIEDATGEAIPEDDTPAVDPTDGNGASVYTLDCSTLTTNTTASTANTAIDTYFSRGPSTTIDTKNSKVVVRMNGKLQKAKCYVYFTTTSANATVAVTFFNNSDDNKNRKVQIAPLTTTTGSESSNTLGTIVDGDADKGKNVSTDYTFTLTAAGTYAIGGSADIMIEKIVVTEN